MYFVALASPKKLDPDCAPQKAEDLEVGSNHAAVILQTRCFSLASFVNSLQPNCQNFNWKIFGSRVHQWQ